MSRLVVEFKEMLVDNKWMDDESKNRVRDKANNVKLEIGYPAYYKNLTFIKTNYNVYKKKTSKSTFVKLKYFHKSIFVF